MRSPWKPQHRLLGEVPRDPAPRPWDAPEEDTGMFKAAPVLSELLGASPVPVDSGTENKTGGVFINEMIEGKKPETKSACCV